MDYSITQAKKLNEMMKFVCGMAKKGFEITASPKGLTGRRIKPYKIRGIKAVYSSEYFRVVQGFVIDRRSCMIVDVSDE